MRSALALVGMAQLAGCQLIFELEDTQNIEGSFVYRRASLGADNTISVSRIPATDAAIQFIFEDEAIDVAIREDGTFSVPKRGASYRFLSGFNLNTGEIIETSSTLTIALDQAGRADIEPITQSTLIDLPLPPGNATRSFVTIGQWTHAPANTGFVDWRLVPAFGLMPIGLLDATANDQVFIVDSAVGAYAADQLAIVAVGSDDSVVMQDGVTVDLGMVSVGAVGQTDCATFEMALASDIDRLQEAMPDAVLEPTTLALTAVPALETGTAGGFQIARTEGMALDADLDMPAHHPFPNHPTVAQIQVLARSPLKAPGTNVIGSVLSGYTMVVEVPRGTCPTNRVPVDSQGIAFGSAIAIDGQLLDTPAQIQISRPGEAVVTWEANGAADFYDVVLFEVLERNDKLELEQKRLYRTREQRIEIEDTLLTPQRHFVLQVTAVTGFPGAANGDYATFGYPNVKASVVSQLFTAI